MTGNMFRAMRARFRNERVSRALLAAMVALVAVSLHDAFRPDVALSIEMKSTTGANGEVFVAGAGAGYSQDHSQPFPIAADGNWHRYVVTLPSARQIDRVRIDPGNGAGEVSIRSLELDGNGGRQLFRGTALHTAVGVAHHLRAVPVDPALLTFVAEGRDPYFDIGLRKAMGGSPWLAWLRVLALAGGVTFVAWLLLEMLAVLALAGIGRLHRLRSFFGKLAALASEERVLPVNTKMLLAVACILSLAVVYVALRLNQSSIGLWETVYPDAPIDQAIEIGTPKRIRSDEWRVHTPWVMNQVLSGNPTRNQNVGGELSPVFTALPLTGILGLPQLKLAGFRMFDLETGISWWWAYKSFALLLSFLWLCLLLTRGNLAASMLGAAWVYTSSFTQWWFSSLLPEIMIAFAMGMIGAIYALFSGRRGHIVAGCLLLLYAVINLALHLYPPFIVPLAYLGTLGLAGYAAQGRMLPLALQRSGFRSAALVLTVIAIAGYGLLFVAQAADTIEAMRNTVYPGRRVSGSGGVPMAKLVYGFFEPLRLGETHLPLPPTNASEASSFVLLAPLMLLVLPWRALIERNGALLVSLLGFCGLSALWIAVDLPGPVERLMQYGGWSLVTPKRAVMALGVGSILACVVLFARTQEARLPVRSTNFRRVSVVAVVIAVATLGYWLRQADPIFFTWQIIVMGTLATFLITTGIAFGRTRLLASGIAVYALATLAVNPLVSGIAAITEKPILLAAKSAGDGPEDRWVVIGDTNFAQGLKAHGLDVFAGSQFLPDRQGMAILDPASMFEQVWNRYATIEVKSDPTRETPLFKARRGDQYAVTLDVCGDELARLGISHIAYTVAVPPQDLACLQSVPAPEDSGIKLFRLQRRASAAPSG